MESLVVDYKNGDSEFWERQVASWRKGDTTQVEYCRQNNLKVSMFGYWKRKISSLGSERFVEVRIKEDIPLPDKISSSIKVLIGDDLAIELSDGFNPDLFCRVVMAVRGLPCG